MDEDTIRVRQAGPDDADAVATLMITAMSQDREWYDYRFPYREEHPEDHAKFMGLLMKAWVSPELDNWVVMLAECWDATAARWEPASFAVWDLSYVGIRGFGSDYKPKSRKSSCFASSSSSLYFLLLLARSADIWLFASALC